MEEKTAGSGPAPHACIFCTVLPLIERRWSEATRDHFRHAAARSQRHARNGGVGGQFESHC